MNEHLRMALFIIENEISRFCANRVCVYVNKNIIKSLDLGHELGVCKAYHHPLTLKNNVSLP